MNIKLTYIRGDATNPLAKGNKIIAHICNTLGKWGKGFVLAVSNKWPKTRSAYIDWHTSRKDFGLGQVQFVQVEPWIHIANMIGQEGIKTGSKGPPIRYGHLKICLQKVKARAIQLNASIHMPRIGTGLSGGRWEIIEKIINEVFEDSDIEVFIYDKD
jgi:O-acetyl-ADP-ribose deacetylase (regulator of RNase III)